MSSALPNLSLITYATGEFITRAFELCASALASGFHRAQALGPTDLNTEGLAHSNSWILNERRGAGFWLWKPLLIWNVLLNASTDDIVLYCDAGRSSYFLLDRFPRRLIAHVIAEPQGFLTGVAIKHLGPISCWTKRDCLLLMDADRPDILGRSIIQATWSLWRRTPEALAFLEEWLSFAQDPRCLTDMPNTLGLPNHPGFIDHRHDQSICSVLTYLRGAPYLDLSHTLTHRLLALRPGSQIAHQFYKRVSNVEALLNADNPVFLARQALRLRREFPAKAAA